MAVLAVAISTAPAPGLEWQSVSRIEATEGFQPRALAIDDSNAAYLLEARTGPKTGEIGQIRSAVAADSAVLAEKLDLGRGRQALFAWRGRCYLAATPRIRIIEPSRDGEPAAIRTLDPIFELKQETDAGGFGGLAVGPDGRIYGSFSGGAITGIAESPGSRNVVFRFEPDGSGFEIVHRGLNQPSAPIFDDLGGSRLVDAGSDGRNGARILRLLDGGFGAKGELVPKLAQALPEGAAVGRFDRGSGVMFSLAREAGGGSPKLVWQPHRADSKQDMAPDPGSLLEAAQAIDLTSDWNGTPHLLIMRGGEEPRTMEILAFGKPADGPDAAGKLATIYDYYDDPDQEDGLDLLDLIADPERRIRWQAAWALSRRNKGLALLNHSLSRGEPLSHRAALGAIGVIARRGMGVPVPGDDQDFSPLPKDELARKAAQIISGLLGHPDPEVRVRALQTLGSARRPAGLIPFPKILADPDQTVRDETLLAAGRLRWRALATSIRTARSQGGGALDTERLADALDALHPPEQLPIYSRQSDLQLRLAAVLTLKRHAHPSLASFVFDTDPEVAAAAVLAIDSGQVSQAFGAVAKRLSQASIEEWPVAARQAAERCAKAAGG